ncbi:polysaccharide biosynthesis tyrosine autokinase [Anaerococcus jeddahensis]|uniref:polysaccharide biosynthesis tyrosine autokinase n=1 Tax=Anaerococcus jeddahensis TaxID=1673719 RepID=UPI0009E5C1FB|nr:polysaccharide biosynthesis tyrosine autokinase [Anaerococcus jeddahensis]
MNDNELDILEVLRLFLRNIYKIIFISIMCSLIFFTVGKVKLKPVYETSTTIMTEKSSNDSINDTYANFSKSNILVSKVIKDLDLNMSYEEFTNKVVVEPVSNTRMINIKVNDTIPERAVDIANKTAIELKNTIGKINKNRVIIVDKARLSKQPINKNLKKEAAVGFVLGFFISTLYILIKDFTNTKIKNIKTLKQKIDLPILGLMSKENKKEQKNSDNFYEDSILYIKAKLQLNQNYKSKKVIGVTSSKENEGNENILYSIAESMASDDLKVIMIDFDLKNCKLEKLCESEKKVEIFDKTNYEDVLYKDKNTKNLYLLNRESIIKNNNKSISSKNIKTLINELTNTFDYVFVNIPPVCLYAHGLIVSNFCDGIILTVKYNDTKEEELESTIDNFENINANIMGLIVSNFDKKIDPHKININ